MNKVLLADAATVFMGQSPPSSTYNMTGQGLPFFQGKADFGDLYPRIRTYCTEPTRVAEAGDILISVRAPVGPTNLCAVKSCIGRGLAAIRPKLNTDQKYLLYFLRFHESALAAEGQGSTFDAISRDDLEDVAVPLPPLPEQQRLAALLDKADHLRRTRRYARLLSDTFLQSVFLEMFGDPATNPKGWDVAYLEELCTKITDGTHFSPPEVRHGRPYITAKNIKNDGIDLSNLTYVSEAHHKEIYKRCDPIAGDVLYIKDGATTGIAAVNTLPYEFTMLSSLALIRLNSKMMLADYLVNYLNYPSSYHEITSQMKGGAIKRLTLDKINLISVTVPPLALQEQFAQVVRRTERLRGQQREAARQAEHLFQTLLARAFRGEV